MRQDAPPEPVQKTCGRFIFLIERPDTNESYRGGSSRYSAMQELMEELGIVRAEVDPRDQMPYDDYRAPEDGEQRRFNDLVAYPLFLATL